MSKALEQLLAQHPAEEVIAALREICVGYLDRIDSEWGSGRATYEQLGGEIDDEVADRLTRKRIL